MAIVFLLFQLIFATFLFFLTIAFITGAPFVPSSFHAAQSMVELAYIKEKDVIYDLGSGDGRLLFLSQKKGCKKITGIEINPWLVLWTKIKILFSGKKNIHVQWGNFWNTNISDADIVYIYLLPNKMNSLAKKLQKELKPYALIVSNSFIFPNWKILRKDDSQHIYVFKKER